MKVSNALCFLTWIKLVSLSSDSNPYIGLKINSARTINTKVVKPGILKALILVNGMPMNSCSYELT